MKQIHSCQKIRPRHTFQGAFFLSNVCEGPARCLQTVQAASEAFVWLHPLKIYLHFGFFGSAIDHHPPPWLLPVETCPGGYFVLGAQNYFLFWK